VSDRDATVLVMAKSPRPGRVKTRLCPPCSPEHAAQIAAIAINAAQAESASTARVRTRGFVLGRRSSGVVVARSGVSSVATR
jgi:glycosyltransferase A (GT-A) superfamily protein (DUF2064 family)